jgi:hypothetical protein
MWLANLSNLKEQAQNIGQAVAKNIVAYQPEDGEEVEEGQEMGGEFDVEGEEGSEEEQPVRKEKKRKHKRAVEMGEEEEPESNLFKAMASGA